MAKYYLNLNQQPSKDGRNYEIHKDKDFGRCYWLDELKNHGYENTDYIVLGYFSSDKDAFDAAIKYARENRPYMLSLIDGCSICCPEINKKD